MISTPIVDFVNSYAKANKARFHMPGHKGVPFLGPELLDITEVSGADELYVPEGIILESEKNAASVFGTARTVYCTGGSTQSIQAMLFAAQQLSGNKVKPVVFAGRNAHKAFVYAAAKLGFEVEWLYPEKTESLCSCIITPFTFEKKLKTAKIKPFAVYLTSPDYLGGMTDIKGISEVCRKFDVPLLVDNAHGAYLAFCKDILHPIALGADMCCDSAHKTLPVLTGGSYLHCAATDYYGFSRNIKAATAVFGSTSPSYLIMQSLDLCNRYLNEKAKKDISESTAQVEKIRAVLREKGTEDVSAEPLKITVSCSDKSFFESFGIEPEYSDGEFTVFMVSPFNTSEDFDRLKAALESLPAVIKKEGLTFVKPKVRLSIREALFAQSCTVNVDEAVGRICAAPTVSCPPAIPVAISGEEITPEHLALFKRYGIKIISVVK